MDIVLMTGCVGVVSDPRRIWDCRTYKYFTYNAALYDDKFSWLAVEDAHFVPCFGSCFCLCLVTLLLDLSLVWNSTSLDRAFDWCIWLVTLFHNVTNLEHCFVETRVNSIVDKHVCMCVRNDHWPFDSHSTCWHVVLKTVPSPWTQTFVILPSGTLIFSHIHLLIVVNSFYTVQCN